MNNFYWQLDDHNFLREYNFYLSKEEKFVQLTFIFSFLIIILHVYIALSRLLSYQKLNSKINFQNEILRRCSLRPSNLTTSNTFDLQALRVLALELPKWSKQPFQNFSWKFYIFVIANFQKLEWFLVKYLNRNLCSLSYCKFRSCSFHFHFSARNFTLGSSVDPALTACMWIQSDPQCFRSHGYSWFVRICRRLTRTVINFVGARDEQSRTWTSFEYELCQLGSPLFPARLFVH